MAGAASVAATGVAEGVMPDQVLGGPVWWYVMGVYLLALVLAAFCLVDSFRPRRAARFTQLREPAWLYSAVHAVFIVCVLGAWVPGIPRALTAVPVVLTPVSLVASVAYLLRVVFPKPSSSGDDPESERSATA